MNAEEIAKGALRIKWWDTESQARRVAEHAEDLLAKARNDALEEAARAVEQMAKSTTRYEEQDNYSDAAAKIRALASQ